MPYFPAINLPCLSAKHHLYPQAHFFCIVSPVMLFYVEAAGRRRRTSSFGSKLKSRKRRPSHLVSDPIYLDPVVETSAKKEIKRRASTGGARSTPSYGGFSGSDGAVSPLSPAPNTTHEGKQSCTPLL